jgi:hypothetical protein
VDSAERGDTLLSAGEVHRNKKAGRVNPVPRLRLLIQVLDVAVIADDLLESLPCLLAIPIHPVKPN